MGRQVLVIDDEPDIIDVLRTSLEVTAGWDVVSASSGHEGLMRARAARPDAILLDVVMPDIPGPDVCRRLRAEPETCHIPVILLTARVREHDRDAFAAAGASGFIPKPFDPLTISSEIARILEWSA